MNDEAEQRTEIDPRQEMFVVDFDLLAEDQLEGLAEEYCTRCHGLNDTEDPLSERARVLAAVRRGDLVIWFDPVENAASLGTPV